MLKTFTCLVKFDSSYTGSLPMSLNWYGSFYFKPFSYQFFIFVPPGIVRKRLDFSDVFTGYGNVTLKWNGLKNYTHKFPIILSRTILFLFLYPVWQNEDYHVKIIVMFVKAKCQQVQHNGVTLKKSYINILYELA